PLPAGGRPARRSPGCAPAQRAGVGGRRRRTAPAATGGRAGTQTGGTPPGVGRATPLSPLAALATPLTRPARPASGGQILEGPPAGEARPAAAAAACQATRPFGRPLRP